MSKIVFVDTETTSLRPDRRAWEIALIVRDEGEDHEHCWMISEDDLDLGNADPFSLKVGGFYERHPAYNRTHFSKTPLLEERDVFPQVEALTRGAHLVGAVPNFDAEVLGARMREYGILPAWHYHLIDVETLTVGTLVGRGQLVPLPWDSNELSQALGVTRTKQSRHTALGDARWARDLYDAAVGGGLA